MKISFIKLAQAVKIGQSEDNFYGVGERQKLDSIQLMPDGRMIVLKRGDEETVTTIYNTVWFKPEGKLPTPGQSKRFLKKESE